MDADLGLGSARSKLFLGFYTAEGLEHALHRYGLARFLDDWQNLLEEVVKQ